jgi:NAD+ synthase (glutamine-hydrolysing)
MPHEISTERGFTNTLRPFNSLYSHGFVRAAVCIPSVRVADPVYNAERIIGLARQASEKKAAVALFTELGVSAYTNDDLFHQDALIEATAAAVEQIVAPAAIFRRYC